MEIEYYNKNENPKCNRGERSVLIASLGYEGSKGYKGTQKKQLNIIITS